MLCWHVGIEIKTDRIFQLQAVDWDGNPFQRRIDGFEASRAAKLTPYESLDVRP